MIFIVCDPVRFATPFINSLFTGYFVKNCTFLPAPEHFLSKYDHFLSVRGNMQSGILLQKNSRERRAELDTAKCLLASERPLKWHHALLNVELIYAPCQWHLQRLASVRQLQCAVHPCLHLCVWAMCARVSQASVWTHCIQL